MHQSLVVAFDAVTLCRESLKFLTLSEHVTLDESFVVCEQIEAEAEGRMFRKLTSSTKKNSTDWMTTSPYGKPVGRPQRLSWATRQRWFQARSC